LRAMRWGAQAVALRVLSAAFAGGLAKSRCGMALMAVREPPPLAAALSNALGAALSKEERKRASLVRESQAAKTAESLGKWATLVTSNLYRIQADAEHAEVEDWDNGGVTVTLRFDLKTYASPREQAEAAFAKARRLRRGSAVLEDLISRTDHTCAEIKRWVSELEEVTGRAAGDGGSAQREVEELYYAINAGFKRLKLKPLDDLVYTDASASGGSRSVVVAPNRNSCSDAPRVQGAAAVWQGRTFTAPSGTPILVGRRRAENELLSTKLAREPDLWFHVRDAPGAHVVLQLSRSRPRRSVEDEGFSSEGHDADDKPEEQTGELGGSAARKMRHVRHAHGAARSPRGRGRSRGTKEEPADIYNGADEADVQMCADLAALFSDCKNEKKARVSMTSAKWVSKPKGAPLGAVVMKKELGSIVAMPDRVAHLAEEEASLRAERKDARARAEGIR